MAGITVDLDYLYVCMLKGMMEDKNYAITVTSVFEPEYFEDAGMIDIFHSIKGHVDEYNALPSRDIVINSVGDDKKEAVEKMYHEIDTTDFSVAGNYDWLKKETNKYLKSRAIKDSIIKSVDVIDKGGDFEDIKNLVESALCKDIDIDLGLNYFEDLQERLKRVLTTADNRVRTYYPTLDEMFNGGYPPYTLNMMIAKVHGHKTNIMTNIICRQAMNGVRVGLATLEMSEDMYSQRFDANFTNLDINRIYHNAAVKPQFIRGIKGVKDEMSGGALYIKEYPTGQATVADFRRWLRELFMRGLDVDIFFCDYISLMKAENNHTGDLYKDGKAISEELRALGFEFNIPVVTVAQINRAGTFLDFESLDMNSIGESFGIPATADSMIIQGTDVEDMMYKNELKWKCVKNRLGGRVGLIGKWYYDNRSLRIYDEQEMDRWIAAASQSGDDRSLFEREV
jgi:hypothetical protein